MGTILIIAIFVLTICKISTSSSPTICGPNTSEIIFTKHGIICATLDEVPVLRNLAVDLSLIQNLMTNPVSTQPITYNNNYGREQIHRRPDLLEDKRVIYRKMLLEKLKRDSLAKRLVRNRINNNQQNVNQLQNIKQNTNIDIQSPIALENPQQSYINKQNQEFYDSLKEKKLINDKQNRNYDKIKNLNILKEYVSFLNKQKSQKDLKFDNNLKEEKTDGLKSLSKNTETNSEEIEIDPYEQQDEEQNEPQVSESQARYDYVLPHNLKTFGYPRKIIKNFQKINKLVFGSAKRSKLNFAFKPFYKNIENKKIHHLNQNQQMIYGKKFSQMLINHKPIITPFNTEPNIKSFIVPATHSPIYDPPIYGPIEQLIPIPSQNIPNLKSPNLKISSNLNILNHQKSSADLVQLSSNNNYYHLRPNYNKHNKEFNLGNIRIEYSGWKPIKTEQQINDEEYVTTHPSVVTNDNQNSAFSSNNFDLMSYREKIAHNLNNRETTK